MGWRCVCAGLWECVLWRIGVYVESLVCLYQYGLEMHVGLWGHGVSDGGFCVLGVPSMQTP